MVIFGFQARYGTLTVQTAVVAAADDDDDEEEEDGSVADCLAETSRGRYDSRSLSNCGWSISLEHGKSQKLSSLFGCHLTGHCRSWQNFPLKKPHSRPFRTGSCPSCAVCLVCTIRQLSGSSRARCCGVRLSERSVRKLRTSSARHRSAA